jgi:hypothetical protein
MMPVLLVFNDDTPCFLHSRGKYTVKVPTMSCQREKDFVDNIVLN